MFRRKFGGSEVAGVGTTWRKPDDDEAVLDKDRGKGDDMNFLPLKMSGLAEFTRIC